MPKSLSGFIDNGRGLPLEGIPAVATILDTSTVVGTTITDADGYWSFSGLPTANEYQVTLSDTAGNAVSRAPWSGEMRELWVRDRLDVAGDLATSSLTVEYSAAFNEAIFSGTVDMTASLWIREELRVGTFPGNPVVVSPTAGNTLTWDATGLYSAGGLTQAAADTRYVNASGDSMNGLLEIYRPIASESFHVIDPGEAVSRFIIRGDGRHEWGTGATSTDTFLARSASGVLAINSKPVTISPDAANIVEWRANGFYAAAGAVSDIWVNTTGDTMTGLLTQQGATTSTNTLEAKIAADTQPRFSIRTDGRLSWGLGGASAVDTYLEKYSVGVVSVNGIPLLTGTQADASYVNVTGDTMTGALTLNSDLDGSVNPMMSFYKGGAWGGRINTYNSRGTVASPAASVAGDEMGSFNWYGRGNTLYGRAVVLDATVEAVNGPSNIIQSRIGFWTQHTNGALIERLRIASDGLVTVNKLTDPAFPSGYGSTPGLLVQHEGVGPLTGLSLAKASTDAAAHYQTFWKARGTWASKVAVASSDNVAQIEAHGWSGSQWLRATVIQSTVSGTVTTTAVPGQLNFFTADSAGTLAARLNISPAGLVGIGGYGGGGGSAALQVSAPAAVNYSFIANAHASHSGNVAFARFARADGTVILGASTQGVVSDSTGAITAISGIARAISWYNSAGTFLGYMPLYSSAS